MINYMMPNYFYKYFEKCMKMSELNKLLTYLFIINNLLVIIESGGFALMKERIGNVRKYVMDYVNQVPDKFDALDLEHIQTKDWIIERYIMPC